jgi:phosphoglycolate phosphatase-like HAD superfamily hydrolase
MSAAPVVLLWDLDGTLLTTGRAGVFALEEAAHSVLGSRVDLQAMRTSGLTDAQIAERILDGRPGAASNLERFLRLYGLALPGHLPRRQGRVMPGVREVLEDLAGDDRVLSLLATGNIEAGAQAKLRHYGLADLIWAGAFCQGPGERALIVQAALAEAERRMGTPPDKSRTFVIGDTPHDIACAQAVGLRCIAVATGEFTADELASRGAWRVFERLPEPDEFRMLVGVPVRATSQRR